MSFTESSRFRPCSLRSWFGKHWFGLSFRKLDIVLILSSLGMSWYFFFSYATFSEKLAIVFRFVLRAPLHLQIVNKVSALATMYPLAIPRPLLRPKFTKADLSLNEKWDTFCYKTYIETFSLISIHKLPSFSRQSDMRAGRQVGKRASVGKQFEIEFLIACELPKYYLSCKHNQRKRNAHVHLNSPLLEKWKIWSQRPLPFYFPAGASRMRFERIKRFLEDNWICHTSISQKIMAHVLNKL